MKTDIPVSPLLMVVLSLVALAGVGCATTGGYDAITSRTWQLTEYADGAGSAGAIADAAFTFHLAKDSRASGQVACNRWQGAYVLGADELRFSALSSTKRRCILPTASLTALEHRFLKRLEQGGRIEMDGERLILHFEDGVRWFFLPQEV